MKPGPPFSQNTLIRKLAIDSTGGRDSHSGILLKTDWAPCRSRRYTGSASYLRANSSSYDTMGKMMILLNSHRRRSLRQLFGCALCMLVIFFAIAAKASMSQPGTPQKQIASMKLQQRNAEQALSKAPQLLAATAFLILGCLSLFSSLPLMKSALAMVFAAPALQCWFSPHLVVRPPPTI